jgi:hypothetical protein
MRSMVHALYHDSLYPGQCITLNLAGCNNSRTYIHQLDVRQLAIPKLMSGLGTSVKKCPN